MQFERRRDGKSYVLEGYGADRTILEAQRTRWPGSYVQWEAMGVPLRGPDGQTRLSEATFALWRPSTAVIGPDELEDPADFLSFEPEQSTPEVSAAPAQPTARRQADRERKPKSVKYKNLTRVERPERNMYGYHVRLGWKGQVYQKWFSDTTYGDRLGALGAALDWRDAKERKLGKPRSEQTLIGMTASNTGLVGVARVTLKGDAYYRALWRDAEGKMHRRWFSIERLGEKRAMRAAIQAHEQGMAARLARP